MALNITISGMPELLQKFKDLKNKHIKAALRKGTRDGAKRLAEAIRRDLAQHSITGATVQSVKVRAIRRSRKRIGAMVTVSARKPITDVPYPQFGELGTKNVKAQHTELEAARSDGQDALKQCNQVAAVELEKLAAVR